MDKPILIVGIEGQDLPNKLVAVADEIIWIKDMKEMNSSGLQSAIKRVIAKYAGNMN